MTSIRANNSREVSLLVDFYCIRVRAIICQQDVLHTAKCLALRQNTLHSAKMSCTLPIFLALRRDILHSAKIFFTLPKDVLHPVIYSVQLQKTNKIKMNLKTIGHTWDRPNRVLFKINHKPAHIQLINHKPTLEGLIPKLES